MIALQFLTVAFAFFYGLIWVGTGFMSAWRKGAISTEFTIFGTTLVGILIWSAGVFLAFLYGWLPA